MVNGDVQIFPLNRPKIIIGSGESSDIVLKTEGVSRKHVFVLVEDDQYFVVDQGSTNGTFINEERLQPGKKVEFTSFFPVRLGENVLLTLLSDEESSGFDFTEFNDKKEASSPAIKMPEKADRSDATRTVSLKDLSKNKTNELVKKRKEAEKSRIKGVPSAAKRKEAAQDKSRMMLAKLGAILIIGGAAYWNFFIKEPPIEEDVEVAKIGELVKVDPKEVNAIPAEKVYLLPETEYTSHEHILQLLKDLRCMNNAEKYLCENIKFAKDNPWGVAQVKLTLHVMVNGEPYMKDALKHLQLESASPEKLAESDKNIRETAMASFLVYGVPDLDYEQLKDYTITFALISPDLQKVEAAITIGPDGLKKLKETLKENALYSMRASGMSAISFTKNFYKVY